MENNTPRSTDGLTAPTFNGGGDLKTALDEHAIVAITDSSGRITYVNDKFCAISKYSRDELIGQDHRIINSGYHETEYFRNLWTTILQGRVWKGEIRNRAKDGSFYWVDTTIVPFLDEDGLPQQFVSIRTDITERKRAEDALHFSKQYALDQWAEAEAVLEAVPAHIAILDRNGTIVRVNQAWTSFAMQNGTAPESVAVGINYMAVCNAATGEAAAQARLFASGIRSVICGESERFSMEYPCHSPTQRRWFMGYVTASPGGGASCAVVAHVEITSQKCIEEQILVLNRDLELRVVERTSELRMAVEALETEITERKRLESEILEISEREQSRIGQDLHDSACQNLHGIAVLAEASARELDREKSPTAAKVREVCQMVRQSAEEVWRIASGLFPVKIEYHGLEVALHELAFETSQRYENQCSFVMSQPVILTDLNTAIHLYRIAQEAVSNAVRHGRAQCITLELSRNDNLVSLVIHDDGIGLSADAKQSGLGLHTMEYRAKMLGGTLEVSAVAGRGTSVICSFPLKESSHANEITCTKEENLPR
ncbi:MAG: PAS domain S-box protein [Verrucomicrobiota bacterium]